MVMLPTDPKFVVKLNEFGVHYSDNGVKGHHYISVYRSDIPRNYNEYGISHLHWHNIEQKPTKGRRLTITERPQIDGKNATFREDQWVACNISDFKPVDFF